MDDRRIPPETYHEWSLTIPQFDPRWCRQCERRHRTNSTIGLRHEKAGYLQGRLTFTTYEVASEATYDARM